MSSKGAGKFFGPISDPEEWRRLLAKPDRHWRTGCSAKSLKVSVKRAGSSTEPLIMQVGKLCKVCMRIGTNAPLEDEKVNYERGFLTLAIAELCYFLLVEPKDSHTYARLLDWIGGIRETGERYLLEEMALSEDVDQVLVWRGNGSRIAQAMKLLREAALCLAFGEASKIRRLTELLWTSTAMFTK